MTFVSFVIGFNGTMLESVYKTSNSKVSLYKPMMRKVHALLGFTMWAASKWTIHTMSDYIDYNWLKYSYLIGRIVTPLFVIGMETYRILGNKKEVKNTFVRRIITPEQRSIVNRLKQGATTDELKSDYPHKTILLFKHLIYDLTDTTHPGGDIIFAEHNFKEISRYVLGTHPSEAVNFPSFIHSQAAYSLLD